MSTKNIPDLKSNQHKKEKNLKYLINIEPLYEIISDTDLHFKQYYIHGKKQKERQCLDLLIWFTLNGKRIYADPAEQYNKGIYVSQSYIAAKIGVSREWVNKLLKRLERCGFIVTYYRNFNTKLYKVSFWFFLQENLKKLSEIFPALRKALLASYKHLSFTLIKPLLNYLNKQAINSILFKTITKPESAKERKAKQKERKSSVDKSFTHQYSVHPSQSGHEALQDLINQVIANRKAMQ